MRFLVLGHNGYIGSKIFKFLKQQGHEVAVAWRSDLEDRESIRKLLCREQPDRVINAAGRTGKPNVDWCESNPTPTTIDNVSLVADLCVACNSLGVHLTHIGSGCVFYGRSPHPDGAWREDDCFFPVSAYSRSKLAADMVVSTFPSAASVRIRMPIDAEPGPRNLISKLASYTTLMKARNSVTFTEDLIPVLLGVSERELKGVFHATNPDTLSNHEIVNAYKELVDPSHEVPMETLAQDLILDGLIEKRRSECELSSQRLIDAGLMTMMRPAQRALRETMQVYADKLRHIRFMSRSG